MSWQGNLMAGQGESDALWNMGEAEWRELYGEKKVPNRKEK